MSDIQAIKCTEKHEIRTAMFFDGELDSASRIVQYAHKQSGMSAMLSVGMSGTVSLQVDEWEVLPDMKIDFLTANDIHILSRKEFAKEYLECVPIGDKMKHGAE